MDTPRTRAETTTPRRPMPRTEHPCPNARQHLSTNHHSKPHLLLGPSHQDLHLDPREHASTHPPHLTDVPRTQHATHNAIAPNRRAPHPTGKPHQRNPCTQGNKPSPAPHHNTSDRASISKRERRAHTQKQTTSQASYYNNGTCIARVATAPPPPADGADPSPLLAPPPTTKNSPNNSNHFNPHPPRTPRILRSPTIP